MTISICIMVQSRRGDRRADQGGHVGAQGRSDDVCIGVGVNKGDYEGGAEGSRVLAAIYVADAVWDPVPAPPTTWASVGFRVIMGGVIDVERVLTF
jgi:hypothetical protein